VEQALFLGGPVMTMDVKGRLAVPSKHIAALTELCAGRLVVCKHNDGCLWLFPQPTWDRFAATVHAWPTEHDSWRRFYLGSANPVELDSGGRLLVPPELREWAQLEREVIFMGTGATFELWDAATYKAREVSTRAAGRPEAVRSVVVR
jgi:MraZ protein